MVLKNNIQTEVLSNIVDNLNISVQFDPNILVSIFSKSLEDYSKRNTIINSTNSGTKIAQCCPRCLKAFALKEARDIGFPREILISLSQIFPDEIGHNGYFLDQGKVFGI